MYTSAALAEAASTVRQARSLPSQLQSVAAFWQIPSYTACWQAHVCEQLAQGCYLTARWLGFELMTIESQVWCHRLSRVSCSRLLKYTLSAPHSLVLVCMWVCVCVDCMTHSCIVLVWLCVRESEARAVEMAELQQSRPLIYDKMMTELEKRTKGTAAKCRSVDCDNYGNSRCGGFCHECYQMQQIARQFWHITMMQQRIQTYK